MRIALYNENPKESKTLSDQLKQCAMEKAFSLLIRRKEKTCPKELCKSTQSRKWTFKAYKP